jgi:protein SCO1
MAVSSVPVRATARLVAACLLAVLVAACGATPATFSPVSPPAPSPTRDPGSYLVPAAAAPPIELTDSSGTPFSLASLRGHPVLLSFGYTHCPDVCPATVGIISQTITALAPKARAVFVTIDPERDTTTSLAEYAKYLATGYQAVTGTPAQVRATADAWGVKYAREAPDTSGGYGMSHTADVFLVDGAGLLRARFPFGTQSGAMTAVVRNVLDSPEPTVVLASGGATTPPASAGPDQSAPAEQELGVQVDSTSVWAGGHSPMILVLSGPTGRIDDLDATVSVQVETRANAPVGAPVAAVPVQPPGETTVAYVATVDIPTSGWWRFAVTATSAGQTRAGSVDVAVLDPGTTAALGMPAPAAHTPTLDDVAGRALAVTTDPAPDLRLYRTSTTDALAMHQPFVLVVDSTRFRTTAACGKALVMVRFLLDRWPSTAFIHLEPFRYDVVSDTAILAGSLSDPTLVDAASAWGIGADPWGATSMPWIFVVDGGGTLRAKYQGVIGSDDVDILLSLIAQGG